MPFFENCDTSILDREVFRPLSHIRGNWELLWDASRSCFQEEKNSYASLLNDLIAEIEAVTPPEKYHDNEDRLAEHVKEHLHWEIRKEEARWVGADYHSIIEQGGFHDLDEEQLVLAAAGRIKAAQVRGQSQYNMMEDSHRCMLAAVLSVILYHRGG